MRKRNSWVDWTNLAIGVWVFISPWVLEFEDDAAGNWTAWVLGAVVAAIAIVALAVPEAAWDEWVGVVIGALLFVAPWVLGYSDINAAATNSWLFGALVLILAAFGGAESQRLAKTHPAGHSTT